MAEHARPPKRISTAHAAAFLGISRWTLRRWGDKHLLPFTVSNSGYRFYKEEDLIAFKHEHAIVHMKEEEQLLQQKQGEKKNVVATRDETLLLPAPPTPEPHENIQEQPIEPFPEEPPQVLIVPPESQPDTPPQPPKKRSIIAQLWKILPFTGASVFLFAIYLWNSVPEEPKYVTNYRNVEAEQKAASLLSTLSFREVVVAAATESSGMADASVEFFLPGSTASVDSLISTSSSTPKTGNASYVSTLSSFGSFQDSPFAYLNGSHGQAGPVALITHIELLRSYPFFANAHEGDKLFIYKEAGKALLFRPVTNEVIAFAPLDSIPSSSYETDGQPVVALRNGMGKPYDMKTFEAELAYIAPDSVVVDRENASRGDYKKSIIVDVVGNKKAQAQELAGRLRLQVSTLPDGEFRPPAGVDFLVILGADRVPLMNYIAPSSTASATPTPGR